MSVCGFRHEGTRQNRGHSSVTAGPTLDAAAPYSMPPDIYYLLLHLESALFWR